MNIAKIYDRLYEKFGPQNWWPVSGGKNSLFEICVGAILTQNAAWINAEKAIAGLSKTGLMSPRAILNCPAAKLQKIIRPSGYYKQKTKKLKIFSSWLIKNYRGNLKIFFQKSLRPARRELLNLWGIGAETADSMLLYAGKKPIFVIDGYAKRLCNEYGVKFNTYDEYQKFFTKGLKRRSKTPSTAKLYNEYHALIVRRGKENGKKFYVQSAGKSK